jgi:uncharacterized protein YndB with AHSA1/START domain
MASPTIKPLLAVSLQRRFAGPREKVFQAWTNPEALRRWWCPAGWTAGDIRVDLRPGGTYRIEMRLNGGGQTVCVTGVFIQVRPPEKLVYTWRWVGIWEWVPETRVTVEFRDVEGETELLLLHENFESPVLRDECRNVWLMACDRLQAAL